MSKKSPQLRFEGFTDDWEERKLGDISYKVKEKNKTGEFTETLTNSAEYGIINQRDFFDKDISNAKNLTGYYVVKNDDFVYNPRISNFAPVGPIKRNKLGRTGVMSPLYYVFRTHDIDKNYFEKYFDTVYWHRFMELNGDSGARADRFAIKDSVFVEMPIPYPTMDEQQKIGSFFKQLDDTIALHQRKLDLLKEQKKGYLQKMFPKNGAKVPELRFAGFADDWEERKLIDLATTYIGLVTTMTENYTNKGTLLIRNSDIKEGRFDLSNPIYLEEQFAEENKTRRMRKGDVVTVHTGDIGTSAMINSELDGAIGFATITTRPTKELDSNFLAWYFNSNYHKKYAKRMSTGDGRSNYNMKDFNKNVIPTPQIDEQQKIGAFFKQLDDTIALHQRKLDLLKEQKKGFLQKMFV
ncbi:restriction endonuclease subunit S (plasmid) [Lactococcus cremoris]|uniref:Restriction endonuclease subunit S n=5 Tax=Streptococcaceae TaxID=1300 RepID=A0AAJ6MK61_LACLC|nr:restriction endonuclease subunit S [Lactococcus cremoris]WOW95002.1 restriction endonuclease subunit S [Lactococcus cremoris]